EVSILQVAERIKELTDSDSPITFLPYEKAYEEGFEDMLRRVPDITKIHNLTGYQPTFRLDEILMSVVDYERSKQVRRYGSPAPIEFQS
ncbi:MAG TPA: nucleoside-diphosphate sugar epimerase, partial [Blastocatellia bacterium]